MSETRVNRLLENVPTELRALRQWVIWRYVNRPDGTATKVPHCAGRPDRHASSTDPATWATFAEALAVLERGGVDGVGFVFSEGDPFCGVDLDGELPEVEQMSAVVALDSYAERSVSGTGHHVIVRAQLAEGRHPHGVGVFDRGRYFVVTGEHVAGTPRTVEERQAELDELIARLLPPKTPVTPAPPPVPVSASDQELIAKAMGARNGIEFEALWLGRWEGSHPSQSEADLALCSLLAFWTGRDVARMDGLFRSSGLYREKWERADYRSATIERAVAGCTETYSPTPRDLAPRPGPDLAPRSPSPWPRSPTERGQVADLAPDLAPTSHSWVPIDLVARRANPPAPPEIVGLFYPGYNHLISGESESLKTWLALAAAAGEIADGRGVLWVDGDDVGAGAVLERLRLLGADDEAISDRFAYVLPDEPLVTTSADLRGDVLDVVRARACRLAVFDGFNPLLGLHGLDPNSGPDVEKFYALIDPIRKAGVAVLLSDNVVKAREARGGWAIGSERKRSKAEVHLGMRTLEPLVRGGTGRAKIDTHKDRPGHLERPVAGVLVLTSNDERCSWEIRPDDSRTAEGVFRPTGLMEKVSRFLERRLGEPASRVQIEEAKLGKREYVRVAIDRLVEEGYATEFSGARGARLTRLERPFVAGDAASDDDGIPF